MLGIDILFDNEALWLWCLRNSASKVFAFDYEWTFAKKHNFFSSKVLANGIILFEACLLLRVLLLILVAKSVTFTKMSLLFMVSGIVIYNWNAINENMLGEETQLIL